MFHYLLGGGTTATEPDPLGSYLSGLGTKQYSDLGNSLKDVTKTISELDKEMSKVVRSMGLTTENSLAIKDNFNLAYQNIVDLGGTLGDVVKQQEDLTSASGKNLILLSSQSKELFAAVSVTGLKGEELQKSFLNAGMEGAHIAENMLKVVEISNKLGVNAQAVAKVVSDNLDKLNRFGFTNGVEGLSKMAGRAAALRFDVNETFDLAEDLMSPDKAIEIAAAVQRLGGAATALTDPLRLMDLAQNDVEGLQQELGKLSKQYTYFNEETQSFQIMPGARRQLNEVASALGIDRKEFEKMAIETAKLEKKMSEIKFPDLDISQEDKEKLANLSQLVTNETTGKKEYVVTYQQDGKTQTKALAEFSTADKGLIQQIIKGTEAQADGAGSPQEKLVKIAEGQLGEYGKLVAAQEKIANTIGMTIGSSKIGEQVLKNATTTYQKLADDVAASFGPKSEFLTNLNNGTANITDVTSLLKTMLSGDFREIITELKTMTRTLGSGVSNFANRQLNNFLNPTIPDGFYTPNGETTSINDGFREPVTQSVGDSLKTPQGTYDIYEKDYFLTATELPKVLQLSSEKGMKKVLDDKMGDISSIISGALKSANVNNTTTNPTPQKQEVVHNINFKVSVDGPRNKLTDMLIEELPKNSALMQYIVKHFKDTKSSGGYT